MQLLSTYIKSNVGHFLGYTWYIMNFETLPHRSGLFGGEHSLRNEALRGLSLSYSTRPRRYMFSLQKQKKTSTVFDHVVTKYMFFLMCKSTAFKLM